MAGADTTGGTMAILQNLGEFIEKSNHHKLQPRRELLVGAIPRVLVFHGVAMCGIRIIVIDEVISLWNRHFASFLGSYSL